ncbi:mitochondrial PGP phosphatase-domain-containing protein [Radiomyces spectabilis]|uniref:mitochondrial PGP phosphatase-domain-containing protein n=1 Tax=Radiomyces spectabilis TaxID=64574 RepID=UPI00221F451F|nr:mitochondrial PGP phosphatase-domain-containing protein [Radiomyces spectabilis]KAI8393926.1 mitochondrial PGP phosphatase-domain-containing protein [Radiomyces spectabilis]
MRHRIVLSSGLLNCGAIAPRKARPNRSIPIHKIIMVQSINVSGIVNAFRVLWNPSLAVPHIIVNDIRSIDFRQLKNKGGIQAIAFDKDNCLTAPYVPHIHPPFEKAWAECRQTWDKNKIVIVSNSAGTNDDKDYKEADKLEASLDVSVLRHAEKKPSGGEALAKHLGPIPASEVAMVGDRIFTDVVFGNLNGHLTIWTRQVITEDGDNKPALFLRRMEHRLIAFLHARNVQPPRHPLTSKLGNDPNPFIH